MSMNCENTDVRIEFAALASAYRKRQLLISILSASLTLLGFGVLFFHRSAGLAIVTFLVLTACVVAAQRTLPKLICPGCELAADCEIVRFCPECGSKDLQNKADGKYFLDYPWCRNCGKKLGVGKGGRRYRICYCTRCGALLDEEGL
jgi:hypothetical protein